MTRRVLARLFQGEAEGRPECPCAKLEADPAAVRTGRCLVRRTPKLAVLCFASCGLAGLALGQQSPAPDRPAEGPLRANPGTTAPGVHPPSPMDGNRFAPGPPPPMPGTQETPPGGQVKTEEKIGTPGVTAGTPSSPGWTPTAPA